MKKISNPDVYAGMERTSTGMAYIYDLEYEGACFMLFPESIPNHTKADISRAKIELYRDHDVVSIRIASQDDIDYLLK